jgi:choline dehydrogenase
MGPVADRAGTRFDDIVVGAGSSGAVLAARLSEDPTRRVLLLEAGPDHARLEDIPHALRDPHFPVFSGFHWNRHAHGQPGAGTPAVPYPLGRVAGGSSAVNGAMALRPLADDFGRWAAVAGPAWTWAAVLPDFIRLERDLDCRGGLHGTDGPIPIARPRPEAWSAPQQAFSAACQGLGLPLLPDLNTEGGAGVGAIPRNVLDGTRISTVIAYLLPARARRNLVVCGDHEVLRVRLHGRRAVGVDVSHADQLHPIDAGRIHLCAGAIHTPALLLRSGIGDAAACRRAGAEPVAHLPGVGEGLMDHPAVVLWMRPRTPWTPWMPSAPPGLQAVNQLLARTRSRPGEAPDLTHFMLAGFPTATVPQLPAVLGTAHAHGISVMLARPQSRGRVVLQGDGAAAAPRIELGLGSAPDDVERLMAGLRIAWQIARSAPFSAEVESIPMWSEERMHNDALLRSATRRLMSGTWHPAGTARMGPASDAGAVVDEHFCVHGVESLRVVDASVMPVLPSVPTNLTCIMLGERAAR